MMHVVENRVVAAGGDIRISGGIPFGVEKLVRPPAVQVTLCQEVLNRSYARNCDVGIFGPIPVGVDLLGKKEIR
jgi:hypothetical protein